MNAHARQQAFRQAAEKAQPANDRKIIDFPVAAPGQRQGAVVCPHELQARRDAKALKAACPNIKDQALEQYRYQRSRQLKTLSNEQKSRFSLMPVTHAIREEKTSLLAPQQQVGRILDMTPQERAEKRMQQMAAQRAGQPALA